MKNYTLRKSLLGLFVLTTFAASSQNVGINTTGTIPSTNAILDLNSGNSNNMGVIIPNVTLGVSLATFNPPMIGAATAGDKGMLVYNSVATNQPIGYYYWNGATWVSVSGAGATVTAANDGTSLNGTTVILGNAFGGTAGKLLQNTEIPFNSFNLTFSGAGKLGIDLAVSTSAAQALEIGALTNTARIGGLMTGGTYNNALATKSDIVYADDANGDLHALPPPTVASTLTSSATGVLSWQNGVVPTGSGTLNYLARWTPSGTQLGIGITQDNGLRVGIQTGVYAFPAGNILQVTANATDVSAILGTTVRPTGYGVKGTNTAGSGTTAGVLGVSNSATGFGVLGQNSTGNGIAIEGVNTTASGTGTGIGVYGITNQSLGYGVYGTNSYSGGTGIYGSAAGAFSIGIYGTAALYGIYGTAATGVYGFGSNIGVSGLGSTAGVNGTGTSYGVTGTGLTAVYGNSTGGSNSSGGVFLNNGGAIYTYAAYFDGTTYYGIYSNAEIYSSSTKSTLVQDADGNTRAMYCDESPEVLFHDYGTSSLVNGRIHIDLDPIWAQNVAINEKHPLRVIITMNDECPNSLYVTNRTTTGFDVVEMNHGTSNASFTYEVIANRADKKVKKGEPEKKYSDMRFPIFHVPLPPAPLAPIDKSQEKR